MTKLRKTLRTPQRAYILSNLYETLSEQLSQQILGKLIGSDQFEI